MRQISARGLRKARVKFYLTSTTKPGDYAPRNGIEFEGWLRQEHAQH